MKSRAAIQPALGQRLIVDEVDIADPQPGQVTLKLFSSGLCHSQLHHMHQPEHLRPFVLGHEATGVVTRVGRDVTHVKEGDHAIVSWVPRVPPDSDPPPETLGVTYHEQPVGSGHGRVFTWSEETIANAPHVVPISKEDPTDVSCIVGCAVLTGAGAVMNTAKVRPGDSVAIFGVGGVGLSALRMAAILEANPIIAVDLKEDKLQLAREFGATHTVNASKTDAVEAIVELTGGGVDFAFDAIGVRATTEQIVPAVRAGRPGADGHGGMAVLIGVPGKEMTLDPGLLLDQRQLRGSAGATYPDRDFPMFLRLHKEGKFPLDRLVTRRYRLDEINQACDDLAAGEILGRAIIEY